MHLSMLMTLTIVGSICVILGVAWVEFRLDRQARKNLIEHNGLQPR